MTGRADSVPTSEPRRADPLLDDVRAARRRVWEDAGGTFEGLLARLEVIQRLPRVGNDLAPAVSEGTRPSSIPRSLQAGAPVDFRASRMARIYLDTSFVSACVTDRTDAASVYRRDESLGWWNHCRQSHALFVSPEVRLELGQSAFRRRSEALAWIEHVPALAVDAEVLRLARILVQEKLMPTPVAGDAVHVAVSLRHRMEYLLSWNVRHLANPNKLQHLSVVCSRLGLTPPRIVTPEFLWGDANGPES